MGHISPAGLVFRRLLIFQPYMSELKPGNIALFQSREKMDSNKETSMNPGRALKLMFPELPDDDVSFLVDKIRGTLVTSDYKLAVGSERKDFKHAYTHDQEDYQNPGTTHYRKSLANSCLRYDFDHLECHPAEAYASGDFRIIWVENEHGEIGARCVAYQNPEGVLNSGPVYGCTDPAIDIIENYLIDNKANTKSDASWVGARLLRIPHANSERFVGPYLDLSPQSLSLIHI